jgi:hypothetical protein
MSLERSDLKQAKIRKVDPELAGLPGERRQDRRFSFGDYDQNGEVFVGISIEDCGCRYDG